MDADGSAPAESQQEESVAHQVFPQQMANTNNDNDVEFDKYVARSPSPRYSSRHREEFANLVAGSASGSRSASASLPGTDRRSNSPTTRRRSVTPTAFTYLGEHNNMSNHAAQRGSRDFRARSTSREDNPRLIFPNTIQGFTSTLPLSPSSVPTFVSTNISSSYANSEQVPYNGSLYEEDYLARGEGRPTGGELHVGGNNIGLEYNSNNNNNLSHFTSTMTSTDNSFMYHHRRPDSSMSSNVSARAIKSVRESGANSALSIFSNSSSSSSSLGASHRKSENPSILDSLNNINNGDDDDVHTRDTETKLDREERFRNSFDSKIDEETENMKSTPSVIGAGKNEATNQLQQNPLAETHHHHFHFYQNNPENNDNLLDAVISRARSSSSSSSTPSSTSTTSSKRSKFVQSKLSKSNDIKGAKVSGNVKEFSMGDIRELTDPTARKRNNKSPNLNHIGTTEGSPSAESNASIIPLISRNPSPHLNHASRHLSPFTSPQQTQFPKSPAGLITQSHMNSILSEHMTQIQRMFNMRDEKINSLYNIINEMESSLAKSEQIQSRQEAELEQARLQLESYHKTVKTIGNAVHRFDMSITAFEKRVQSQIHSCVDAQVTEAGKIARLEALVMRRNSVDSLPVPHDEAHEESDDHNENERSHIIDTSKLSKSFRQQQQQTVLSPISFSYGDTFANDDSSSSRAINNATTLNEPTQSPLDSKIPLSTNSKPSAHNVEPVDVNTTEKLIKESELTQTVQDLVTEGVSSIRLELSKVTDLVSQVTPIISQHSRLHEQILQRESTFENKVNDVTIPREIWDLIDCARPYKEMGIWVWHNGKISQRNNLVPWNHEPYNNSIRVNDSQARNENTDKQQVSDPMFIWKPNTTGIVVADQGLYEIRVAVFAKVRPCLQVLVNGEPVISAMNNNPSIFYHQGKPINEDDSNKENALDSEKSTVGQHPDSGSTCVSLVDFLCISQDNTKVSIRYRGGRRGHLGHGFLTLSRVV